MPVKEAPARIGLLGLFGVGNFGNDGSLEAMLRFLRSARPQSELVCICSDPARVQRDHGIEAWPMRWPSPTSAGFRALNRLLLRLPRVLHLGLQTLRRARTLDAVIIPGTGILDDFGERPWATPLSLCLWCLTARLCGTTIAFVSIGAGPINRAANLRLMKLAARMAHYRSYRDTVSRDFMRSIGFDVVGDPIYPDIAFSLPEPRRARKPPDQPLTVGLGVMAYYGWQADADRGKSIYECYIGKLARFADWLLQAGHRVRLLTGQASDQCAVGDLLALVAARNPGVVGDRIIAEPAASLHDVMQQLLDTEVVVATRFHNVVCALKLGKPTISLGYAGKNDALLTEVGLGDFCQHVEQIDVDLLIRQFGHLLAGRKHYEERIRCTTTGIQEQLAQQDAFLKERLLP
jgi:polysaccharide pyruvyl transferase WcaK-like protein